EGQDPNLYWIRRSKTIFTQTNTLNSSIRPTPSPPINITGNVKLSCRLDLDFITRTAWNTEYKPERFRALIMRIREPRTTANIYQSGSLVCTGARSIDESHRAARRFARILQKLGFPVSFQNFKIHNMVVSCNTFPVVLEALNLVYHQHCSYEPELFPALFFKMVPGITAIVFVQGKLILSGAKSPAEVSEALQVIYPVLRRFMKH
uniref:TATA-box-binding protein-like n=1 Tax=Kryptolebias marmoratus TaxID=37003 RepID=A0A3Q2ZT61_KRYMA